MPFSPAWGMSRVETVRHPAREIIRRDAVAAFVQLPVKNFADPGGQRRAGDH
jgi:hypothetical protein